METADQENAVSSSESTGELKAKRRPAAVGLFPRMSLKKSLELPAAIRDLGEGQPVRRLTVFKHLNRSAESGSARSLIAAANSGYGLITGSAAAEHLGLTSLGEKLVQASSPLHAVEAAFEALFSNKIFTDFVIQFKDRSLRNDEIAIDYLRQKHKLSEEDARACFAVFRENIADYGLTEEHSGRPVIVSPEVALNNLGAMPGSSQNGSSGHHTDAHHAEGRRVDGKTPQRVQPESQREKLDLRTAAQFHFNIQVHLPSDASTETYEAIFSSMAKHLLGQAPG